MQSNYSYCTSLINALYIHVYTNALLNALLILKWYTFATFLVISYIEKNNLGIHINLYQAEMVRAMAISTWSKQYIVIYNDLQYIYFTAWESSSL